MFPVSAELRASVSLMAASGMSAHHVASIIGCTSPTVRRHFAAELRAGRATIRATVINQLFRAAEGGNVAALKRLERMTARR